MRKLIFPLAIGLFLAGCGGGADANKSGVESSLKEMDVKSDPGPSSNPEIDKALSGGSSVKGSAGK